MKTIHQVAAVAAVLAGAAIGFAGPASAEALDGAYTATYSNGAGGTLDYTWTFTPCGPDCTRMDPGAIGAVTELRLQGSTWSGTAQNPQGETCTTTIDDGSLAGRASLGCGGLVLPIQLTKAG
jgi:hypothetical protein